MNADELRETYQRFFEGRGHKRLRSAPLLPENDPSVLFTTAGMHPLVPFLLGEPHPLGRRLTDVQKCIRTNDIAEVGDAWHLTFFEMLGNWSLGDYFKAESLAWSHEFLTRVLGLDPRRLAVTVFAGDTAAPRDEESAGIWLKLGLPAGRIYYLPKADNWWGPVGQSGPCGPDSEMFYDNGLPDHPGCQPGCPCGKWLEVWNNVFMEYERTPEGRTLRLAQRNVDTGMGLERTLAALQDLRDIFQVETLQPLVARLEDLSGRKYGERPAPFRVITDHLRAATFAITDGASPANVEAGYVVRRLVRRAVRFGHELGIRDNFCAACSGTVADLFAEVYPELERSREAVAEAIDREESKFKGTLERGLKYYHRAVERLPKAPVPVQGPNVPVPVQGRNVPVPGQGRNTPADTRGDDEPGEAARRVLPGAEAFDLFETYGFPLPLTVELAHEEGLEVDEAGFERCYQAHQEQSRQAQAQKFKGGLADHAEETTRLHTAAHLLQAALRRVLGPGVEQRGSNITAERLRFDFTCPDKLNPAQLAEVEDLVNAQIAAGLPVTMEVMPRQRALASGALGFFSEKYGAQVKVYSIGDFSREVCGGPHVDNTRRLGRFKIIKEEAVKQGVRRIRAILED